MSYDGEVAVVSLANLLVKLYLNALLLLFAHSLKNIRLFTLVLGVHYICATPKSR